MKLITFAIPCYNSQEYMNHCIDSIDRTIKETVIRSACKIDNLKNEVDEEIRLLYVAMTRARELLYMVGCYNFKKVNLLHKSNVYNCNCYWDMILRSIDKSYMPFFQNKNRFVIYKDEPMQANVNIVPINEIEIDSEAKETQIILDTVDDKLLQKLMSIKNAKPDNQTFTLKNTVTNILAESKDYENLNSNPINLDVSDRVESIDALKLGTAYHAVMQYVNFNENEESIVELIDSLESQGVLDKEISKHIEPSRIVACIDVLKPYILRAKSVYKEKQFLLQENYNKLVKNSDNNTKVIVQGVIDTVLIFDGEAYLIDYKTNKTQNEEFLKNHYKLQLEIYKLAFEKATNIKITKKFLYSFYLNKLIEIN